MVAPKKESAASFLRRMKRASSSETVLEAVKADSSYGKKRNTRRYSCSPGGCSSSFLNCSRMEVGSWFTNSPVNAAPEVVYPSVPLFYTDYGLNGCIRSRLKDKKAAIFEFVSRTTASSVGEAVGTVQSRFKGDFFSGSWQPSTFPALLRSHGLSSPRFSPQLWIWLLSSIEL
ncbi:hypothetical protein F2Q69_00049359 [Brassica cretica]|uniref:Uncharacterized protein n=1 Tax=Brassica cretica TaxID=69181 RepID=A0A8S9PRJ8_BRACR|nr:hypothetical protein F2Q69_00049359 [Brassica cretica]